MLVHTDMVSLRRLAIELLNMAVHPYEHCPLRISHPYAETALVYLEESSGGRFFNLLEPEDLTDWKCRMAEHILGIQSALEVFRCVSAPYRVLLLRAAEKYLSEQDMLRVVQFITLDAHGIQEL